MTQERARELVKQYGGVEKAWHHSGLTRIQFRDLTKGVNPRIEVKAANSKTFQVTYTGDEANLLSVDESIDTLEKAIAKAKVDTAIWEVADYTINFWDMPGGEGSILHLCQIKAKLRRRVSKSVEHASKALIERMMQFSPVYKSPPLARVTDPHCLEVCLFDHHFGKLAWGQLTGNDYDLKIAEGIFKSAARDLVAKARGFPIEMFQIPFGNDFLHIDGLKQETAAGTPMDADGRYEKVFTAGCMAMIWLVDYLATIAPVNIMWVPGNHDRSSSYHVAQYLRAWFRTHQHVMVNVDPPKRKYFRYGVSLIGYTHGDRKDDVPAARLPLLMAEERSQDFADTVCHEWHLGHLHSAKEMVFQGTQTHGGVRVRVLPSLSGTDAWHFENGFCTANRAAEAYLWSKSRGYTGHFSSLVERDAHGTGRARNTVASDVGR